MNSVYEQLFKKNNNKKENLLKVTSVIISAIIILITFYFALFANFVFLILCFLEFLAISWLIKQFYMEFEYSFVNGAVDVDIIYAKSRRKRIASFDCSNVYEVGEFKDLNNMNNVIMAANENSDKLFYFTYDSKTGKQTIVLQPNEQMLERLKRFIPRSVTINKI